MHGTGITLNVTVSNLNSLNYTFHFGYNFHN